MRWKKKRVSESVLNHYGNRDAYSLTTKPKQQTEVRSRSLTESTVAIHSLAVFLQTITEDWDNSGSGGSLKTNARWT